MTGSTIDSIWSLSEADFIATLSTPDEVPICIRIPHDPTNSNWNFNGQTIDLTIKATSTMKNWRICSRSSWAACPWIRWRLSIPWAVSWIRMDWVWRILMLGLWWRWIWCPRREGGRGNNDNLADATGSFYYWNSQLSLFTLLYFTYLSRPNSKCMQWKDDTAHSCQIL